MTAYIKMIDVWMIFTMLYPFCVVTLYSVMEVMKNRKTSSKPSAINPTETREMINLRTIRTLTFLLDWGLPLMVIIFIFIFWILGLTNSADLDTRC